jgi:hypothetical protein
MGLFNFQLKKKQESNFDKRIAEIKKIGDQQYQFALETSKKIKAETKAIQELQIQINHSMCFNVTKK